MGLPFHPPIMASHRSATQAGRYPQEEEKKLMEEAMSFIVTVREAFKKDNPAKYREFIDVMINFRKKRIDVDEVDSRVKELFRDSPGLLAGFNVFLPDGYKARVQADELAARVVTDLTLDEHNDNHMSE